MKPIGSKWKRLSGCNDVWIVLEYVTGGHRCKCIIHGDTDYKVGDIFNFQINSDRLWEPYYGKYSNFKDIYDILNNEG
jgi:hypothetical protein